MKLKSYQQLSLEEREKMYALKSLGLSLRDIAKNLGRADTTIGRELKRNKTGPFERSNEYLVANYLPCKAQQKATKRALKQRTKAPLKEPLIFLYVRTHLRGPFFWSPEQISGRLPLDYPGKQITKETIYQYIYSPQAKRYQLWEYLTLARKKRMKKEGRKVRRNSKIPGAISIDFRPQEVEKRVQLGHWETDLIIGKQTDKTALSVTVERKTRLAILTKLSHRTAAAKSASVITRLLGYPEQARLTLTTDNGAENSYHQLISKTLNLAMYFCHSYHSWEKGTVENTNGRIRKYIPKGVSLDQLTTSQIQQLEEDLNNTPRKCLGYLTPQEKMRELSSI